MDVVSLEEHYYNQTVPQNVVTYNEVQGEGKGAVSTF